MSRQHHWDSLLSGQSALKRGDFFDNWVNGVFFWYLLRSQIDLTFFGTSVLSHRNRYSKNEIPLLYRVFVCCLDVRASAVASFFYSVHTIWCYVTCLLYSPRALVTESTMATDVFTRSLFSYSSQISRSDLIKEREIEIEIKSCKSKRRITYWNVENTEINSNRGDANSQRNRLGVRMTITITIADVFEWELFAGEYARATRIDGQFRTKGGGVEGEGRRVKIVKRGRNRGNRIEIFSSRWNASTIAFTWH